MKRKPSGQKYRNLTVRKGVIYYQRRVGGKPAARRDRLCRLSKPVRNL